MKRGALLLVHIMYFNCLMAQQETFTLKAGQSVASFKAEHIYRYPEFIPSKVIYKDGVITKAKLNYNQLNDKMEFIDPKGDTLVLIMNNIIKMLVLGADTFYYDSGYLEYEKQLGSVIAGSKTRLKLIDKQRAAGMGMTSSTAAIDSYDVIPEDPSRKKLTVSVNHVFTKLTSYYISDDAALRFIPATQKNLIKIMPGKSEVINQYCKSTAVNFSKLEEIERLLNFVQTP